MCLIIHREDGQFKLPDDIIMHNKRTNPDGFGIAWRDDDGTVQVRKYGPADFGRFHETLKKVDATDAEYVAHFRTATHGKPCEDLSHPFTYEDGKEGPVHVFHNGVIGIATDRDGSESDTSRFVKVVLAKLESRWWLKSAYRFLVENSIGYSRLLVMTKDVTVRFNENAWLHIKGIYYSTTPIYGSSMSSGKGGGSSWSPKATNWKPVTRPVSQPTRGFDGWTKGEDGFWHKEGEVAATEADVRMTEPEEPDYAVATDSDAKGGWYQAGHYVEALTEVKERGGDLSGTAICTVCRRVDDYYVIDGTTYIDIIHDDEEFDDEDESDDAVMEGVLAN